MYHIDAPGHEVCIGAFSWLELELLIYALYIIGCVDDFRYADILCPDFSPYIIYFALVLGAATISSNLPVPSVDDLAAQVAEVLDHSGYLQKNLV